MSFLIFPAGIFHRGLFSGGGGEGGGEGGGIFPDINADFLLKMLFHNTLYSLFYSENLSG